MNKTTAKILEMLLRYGRCSILVSSVRDHRAAQKLIDCGFCTSVKLGNYRVEEFYSLRLRMTQEGKDSVIVS